MNVDEPTLDQLRAFVAIAESGSFSAAGRRVGRVQSAVTYLMRRLEDSLAVELFEGERRRRLSRAGEALLPEVRAVLDASDRLRRRAATLREGIEPELSLVVDALFPVDALAAVGRQFERRYPMVPLILNIEALGAVARCVAEGHAHLGVSSTEADVAARLEVRHLFDVPMCTVASSEHPLASVEGPIATAELRKHRQIILASRDDAAPSIGVLSPVQWRVSELAVKHSLLREGLGWGRMPQHAVQREIDDGTLATLEVAAWGASPPSVPLALVERPTAPPGPAAQWIIAQLQACAPTSSQPKP